MLDELLIVRSDETEDSDVSVFYLNGAKLNSVVGYEYKQDNPHIAYLTLKLNVYPFNEAAI